LSIKPNNDIIFDMRKLLTFILLCVVAMTANAQMTFTLNGLTYADCVEENPLDGSTTIKVPAGTNLNGLITAVQVDGQTVNASQIKPNPTTTNITSGELEVFVYNNKAYGFRFVEDVWFCAVFISDCHTNQGSGHDGTSASDLTTIMNNICNMGKDGKKKVSFTTEGATSLVPKTDIIFCLGDIDQDKGDDGSNGTHANFLNATAEVCKTKGIPFIFIAGNHDLSPDYWDNGTEKGVSYGGTGGSHADDETISAIQTNNTYWNNQNVFDENIQYFIDNNKSSSNYFQSKPFTFKFKGVRFYCAHTYWFQKLYKKPGILGSATYYAPDGVISALDTFVESHSNEPSVWMQHYPFLAGSDCDRWWLDQNNNGNYITSSDNSIYGSSTSGIALNDANSANTLKKNPISEIMAKTAGKVDGKVQHFSGHYHRFADLTYTNTVATSNVVRDYTVAANGNGDQSNNAYVVLIKRSEGVKEVIQTQF
jgi:hypothetical protein